MTLTSGLANKYEVLVKDDLGDLLIPTSAGDMIKVIDLCWEISRGQSIHEACIRMGVHPLRFMSYRAKHPEIDELCRFGFELAGEADLERAAKLTDEMDEDNLQVNIAKSKFYVWRGSQRFKSTYGGKAAVEVNAQKTTNIASMQMATVIRTMDIPDAETSSSTRPSASETASAKEVDLEASEYEIRDTTPTQRNYPVPYDFDREGEETTFDD